MTDTDREPVVDETYAAQLPAAVLWDMDGTLVDTEPYWIAAEHELVAAHGGEVERRVRALPSSAMRSRCRRS